MLYTIIKTTKNSFKDTLITIRLTNQIEALGSSLDGSDMWLSKNGSKVSNRRRKKSYCSINQHTSNFESSFSDELLHPTLVLNGYKIFSCQIKNSI